MIDINNLIKTEPEIKKTIASNFKKRRKEHKKSQKQMEKESGVSLGSLKRFEQSGEISLSSLIKLSQSIDEENNLLNLFTSPYYENIEDMLE